MPTGCFRSALFAATLAALPAAAQSPVFLTVTGAVENTNRGPMDPATDKLFAFNEVAFDAAHELTLEALAALPQTTVRADFPAGGPEVAFTGPTLQSVLDAAGATGDTVAVQALDGYAVEMPVEEAVDKGAVLALARNGEPFGIGGFGPAQLVFPRAERPDLAEMPDDWWIWQIFHVRTE